MIVRLVFVYMVYFWQVVWVLYEMPSDEPVNHNRFRFTVLA